tara:strand:- start:1311 stop:1757 length:447 start_codon:yes stop_codon:yes gene_type:complete
MNKIFILLILLLNTVLFSQNNSDLFKLELNISNIQSEGNLMIAVWSDPDSWNNNIKDSSGKTVGFDYGFEEKVQKGKFSTIINLPEGTYFISILLDENFNNILDKNFIGIPNEQYGFSSKKQIRFRKPKFDEGSIEFFKNSILNIELQ